MFSKRRRERQLGGSDFLILNQQFNTLIKAGLPILRALDLLADRATSPKLRPVLSKVRDRVREGKSLSEAISEAGVFSKVYATAILAGEKSGNLSGVLDYYIAYQNVSTGVKKKILATLVYPVLLITVATIIVTYLVTFVIPKFAILYRDLNVELPGPTQFLIALTVDYRYVVIGAFALVFLAAFGILLWSRTEEGGVALRPPEIPHPRHWRHAAEISGGAVFPHAGDAADGWHPAGRRLANSLRRHQQQADPFDRHAGDANGSRRRIASAALWPRKGPCPSSPWT